jgi:hypothetical protein
VVLVLSRRWVAAASEVFDAGGADLFVVDAAGGHGEDVTRLVRSGNGVDGPCQTTVRVTSMLPRVAFEYGHIA